MSSRTRAETCKHSTGRVGNVAVFTLPTCPYMHKTAGFMKRGKINVNQKSEQRDIS